MTEAEKLAALSEAATQGVWRYRPMPYDDWGIVKSSVQENGYSYVLAQFRDPDKLDEETLSQHRAAKTDPWSGNAQFVVALVNAYRANQLVLIGPDAVAQVARAMCEAIVQQDDPGFHIVDEPWDGTISYLDQGETDFKPVARAALAAMGVK